MTPQQEMEPQMALAEQRYPAILASILAYTQYCDDHGDEDNAEYRKVAEQLHALTGKDMARFNLHEWWEAEGAEVLAFRIALPDPVKMEGVTRSTVAQVVARIGCFELPSLEQGEPTFGQIFSSFLDDYYYAWLKLHCKAYSYRIFGPQKDRDGKRVWLDDDEKVDLLWPAR